MTMKIDFSETHGACQIEFSFSEVPMYSAKYTFVYIANVRVTPAYLR